MHKSTAKVLLTATEEALRAPNPRWAEEAQLGRKQTAEPAGGHIQPSTNKLFSAGLLPADPARPFCRSGKAELCWRLEIQSQPAAIPRLPFLQGFARLSAASLPLGTSGHVSGNYIKGMEGTVCFLS